jgi:chemotaxis protein MotB
MIIQKSRALAVAGTLLGALALVGCGGHSDEEWQAAQRTIAGLKADLDASKKQHDDDAKKYADAEQQIDGLNQKLKDLGVGLSKAEQDKMNLKQAMSEYEQRLKQLDEMKARFKDLKSRLDKLTGAGLKAQIRHNKMVIALPGDVLFDSGKDSLKPEGRKILKQVADIIRGDTTLAARDFQVAGHTDKEPYGSGPFLDNWGLSLMRARQVLTFMVSADKGEDAKGLPTGGGLSPAHWAAAGYGAMDPAAGTVEQQSREEEQRNRRVELVLQPDVNEMLDLKNLTGS